MKLVYFAWVRERVGKAEESRAAAIGEHGLERCAGLAPGAKSTLTPSSIRNRSAPPSTRAMCAPTPRSQAREIAFFPPMTGG